MGPPDNEKPAPEHKCGFLDYAEALGPLPDKTAPNIILTSDTPSADASVAEHGARRDVRTGLQARVESGDEADEEQSPTRRLKPIRRSTGGTTHQGRQRRSDAKSDRSSDGAKGPKEATSPPNVSLKIPQEADDGYVSEADMSGVDDYYRTKISSRNPDVGQGAISGPRSRGPRSTSRGVGADSSGCSDGECGIQPEVFDSDLESEIGDVGKATHAKKMRKWKSLAKGKFEKMLLECIVNTEEIPPDYGNMYVDPKVIGKLERVTRMSLLRPKAFGHGVLAGNRVTGAVLWGPPGTGKSLLAKGVARQSNFNMILASTAELWQKCHGDDEKVITALFSMARKIHPTIVFIDEADAMLGSRKAGEKRHIRSMMNQFLMEWDGLKSGKDAPFILLATNRPFDLDPAVLRRAPMQIHLDIPTAAQRRGILDLILKKETLAPDVSIEKLVKLTPRYTGSDLKNMCVTAATECVWEMEEDSKERTLYLRHFKSAMVNIKATGLSKTMEHELRSFGRNEKPGTQPRRQEDE